MSGLCLFDRAKDGHPGRLYLDLDWDAKTGKPWFFEYEGVLWLDIKEKVEIDGWIAKLQQVVDEYELDQEDDGRARRGFVIWLKEQSNVESKTIH